MNTAKLVIEIVNWLERRGRADIGPSPIPGVAFAIVYASDADDAAELFTTLVPPLVGRSDAPEEERS